MALTVPFAVVFDLEQRWRPLSSEDRNRADVLLGDASQLILDEDKHGVLAALTTPTQTHVRIVCAMVKRAMLVDTGGASQVSQGAGPFNIATTYTNPAGDLYLTAAERRALGFKRPRAGSVDMWASGS